MFMIFNTKLHFMTVLKFSFIILFIFSLGLSPTKCQSASNKIKNEAITVSGQKHIFTISTPPNWINDKELAKQALGR